MNKRKLLLISGWVVAVANTYANAKKAAAALKIAYDGGPNAKLSSQSLLEEAKRLQKLESKKAAEKKVEDERLAKLKAELEKAAASKAGQSAAPAAGAAADADGLGVLDGGSATTRK